MRHLIAAPLLPGSLLAAGTSICGVTAISALAPAIAATQAEVSVAVANVVLFGTAGMLLLPHAAHYLLGHCSEAAGMFLVRRCCWGPALKKKNYDDFSLCSQGGRCEVYHRSYFPFPPFLSRSVPFPLSLSLLDRASLSTTPRRSWARV